MFLLRVIFNMRKFVVAIFALLLKHKNVKLALRLPNTRVGISGTTAKSRQRKFVPSSHTGPFALVASSHKSQTKVGTLACFDFL